MNLTSQTAGQVTNVVIIWAVYAVTHSALDVAIVGVVSAISTVGVTLPAEVWVDRYNRYLLLLSTNAVRVVCLGLLALLTEAYGFQLVVVIAIVTVWSAAGELFRSTNYSILPDLVNQNEVANANGVTQSGTQLVGSASNVLGGALVIVAGAALAFVYGAAGFALAAILSTFLFYRSRTSNPQSKPETQKQRMMGREIKEGFRWLIAQRGFFQLSVSAVAFNFLFGLTNYFLVIYVSVALHAGAFLFGAVLASSVIGGALGSLLVGRTNAIAHAGKVWILVYGAVSGSLLLLLGLVTVPVVALVANFGIGFAGGFAGIVWLTAAQNLVPAPMRGRYFAIDGLLSFIGGPPSIAAGGILITLIGVVHVFELGGVLMLVFAAVFAVMRSLWMLDGRPRPDISY